MRESTNEVVLPFNWEPRKPQMRLWSALESGVCRRAMMVAHRRWGKDDVALHFTATAMHERIGTYWHCLPEYSQAKKVIWNAVNPRTGKRRIDEAFPKELRETTNSDEMFIRMKCGSTWQVIGSDNFHSLVGAGVCGIVFSEWAKANPSAWAYLAPILVENDGWALFITTPQGHNHAKRLYDMAAKPGSGWFAERQTVEDSGFISRDMVEAQRAEYHALYGPEAGDALIRQEFYCDFDAPVLGSYWGQAITNAEHAGRFASVPVNYDLPVHTVWGLGDDDPVGLWNFQILPDRINIVDYTESHVGNIETFVDWLRERRYYGNDFLPPSARMRDYSPMPTRTRLETLRELGRHPVLVPDVKLADRIHAGRLSFAKCYFDVGRTERGIDCLKAFKADWDEDNNVPKSTPAHNWASYAAFAWGHFSVSWELPRPSTVDLMKEALRELHESGINDPKITVDRLLKLNKGKGGRARPGF